MSVGLMPRRIRFLHWAMASTVVFNALVLEPGSNIHRVVGLLGGVLVFVRAFQKRSTPHANPAAAWVSRAIWLSLICLAVTGVMMGLDMFWGNPTLKLFHVSLVFALAALIFIHLAGVFYDSWKFGRRTWMRMITG